MRLKNASWTFLNLLIMKKAFNPCGIFGPDPPGNPHGPIPAAWGLIIFAHLRFFRTG